MTDSPHTPPIRITDNVDRKKVNVFPKGIIYSSPFLYQYIIRVRRIKKPFIFPEPRRDIDD